MIMAKKSVDAALAAYKSKGMKAPRPGAGPALDPSKAPSHKGSVHKEPVTMEAGEKQASMAPDTKKKSLPREDAPAGVAGVNGGSAMAMPKGGCKGESEV